MTASTLAIEARQIVSDLGLLEELSKYGEAGVVRVSVVRGSGYIDTLVIALALVLATD